MISADTSNNVLEIKQLEFAYAEADASLSIKSAPVISNLSLSVAPGEIVSILGGSGCGKSTLLNLIAGILTPDSGTIEYKRKGTEQKTGYIFQDDALFPWRTIEQNLLLVTALSKSITSSEAESRVAAYLKSFHLDKEILCKYPAQLSGGMRQRVSIIQSLMFDPQLLLLDEPFSALDFFTKLSLEKDLYELVKNSANIEEERKAAILVTHDIEEAVAISDRIILLQKGGRFAHEFRLDLGEKRLPEDVRGTQQFADAYQSIWAQLKTVIKE